ncbi:MAG: hypothetical protein QXO37_02520 [Candidatus Nitrosocaldaceae archaeon]
MVKASKTLTITESTSQSYTIGIPDFPPSMAANSTSRFTVRIKPALQSSATVNIVFTKGSDVVKRSFSANQSSGTITSTSQEIDYNVQAPSVIGQYDLYAELVVGSSTYKSQNYVMQVY